MTEVDTFGSDWIARLYIERLQTKYPALTYRLFLDEGVNEYVVEYDRNGGTE